MSNDTNTQYHLMFRKGQIERESVLAVRKTIKSGLFKKDNSVEMKQELIRKLNEELSNIYNLDVLPIEFIDGYWSVGAYCRDKIIVNKPSLVTFTHEFCHYLQHSRKKPNTEDLARGWSHSLFYLSTPKLFENAIRKGLLIWQKTITSQEPREEVREKGN